MAREKGLLECGLSLAHAFTSIRFSSWVWDIHRVQAASFKTAYTSEVREDVLWVVAICHSHRKPEFWLPRLSS